MSCTFRSHAHNRGPLLSDAVVQVLREWSVHVVFEDTSIPPSWCIVNGDTRTYSLRLLLHDCDRMAWPSATLSSLRASKTKHRHCQVPPGKIQSHAIAVVEHFV